MFKTKALCKEMEKELWILEEEPSYGFNEEGIVLEDYESNDVLEFEEIVNHTNPSGSVLGWIDWLSSIDLEDQGKAMLTEAKKI